MLSHTNIVTDRDPTALARMAIALMVKQGIDPTPINYAVWFHYVEASNSELKNEIDLMLQKKELRITDDVNIYLYNKYIDIKSSVEKTVAITSDSTQTVLQEIMNVITNFSNDTANYNSQIDQHVGALSEKIIEPQLKALAAEIVARAVSIRESGTTLTNKLEESRKEVMQLKVSLEKVTNEANLDFLTRTANRKALDAKLEELAKHAKETGTDVSLLMIDIDHFKKFNDRFGHLIGDEVLRKVSHELIASVKGKDFVARYGGEEFAVLLPGTSLAIAGVVAENIRKNIADTELVRKDTGESVGIVTVSIGVARYRIKEDSIPMFISRADDALYRSKLGGRNRVTLENF